MDKGIIFLFIMVVHVAHGEMHCKNTQTCTCIPDKTEYEFQCPPDNFMKDGVVIHINQDKSSIEIDCYNQQKIFNLDMLPQINDGNSKSLVMTSCPPPPRNFKEILNKFSVNSIESLKFWYSVRNATLSKEYFEDLHALTWLIIKSNEYITLSENVFENTPNLVRLELHDVEMPLTTNIFNPVPNLQQLDIVESKLESLPDGVFKNLKDLRALHLWGNKLTTLNDSTFENLSSLKSLELSANNIENISEDAFIDLTNLTHINFLKNNLGKIPVGLFRNNRAIKLIKMTYNSHLQLPDYVFSNLTALEDIDLRFCHLDLLPEHIFEGSTQLRIIRLTGNNLKSLSSSTFEGLVNLTELYLDDNKIEILSDTFKLLKKLEILNLGKNFITSIEDNLFRDLVSLKEINLHHNKITEIHERAFYNNQKLERINLSYNKYRSSQLNFPAALLEGCNLLVEIDLSHNFITEVENILFLENKVYLKTVDLSFNNITRLNVRSFQTVATDTVSFNLAYNNITNIDFTAVEILASEQPNLDIYSFNSAGSSSINISNNSLKCDCRSYDLWRYFNDKMIPQVKVMFNLIYENLNCFSPSELRDVEFVRIPPNLLTCRLNDMVKENQGCPEICSCSWRPYDKSIIVDCSYRNLTQIPQIHTSRMNSYFQYNQTEVSLEGNHLITGPNGFNNSFDNVTRLFLSHNQIKNITWLPPKLKVLTLDHNNIKRLGYTVLHTLNTSDVSSLTLDHNPWVCDCSAENITNFVREHSSKVDTSNIRCDGTGVLLRDQNKKNLCDNVVWIALIIVLLCFFLALALLAATYYRYQEEIKVWLFAKNLCLWWVTEEELDKDKTYDAFISYSHKDEDFVTQNLLPVLEEGPQPYKLCLHYRDWLPGEFITKQIATSVYNSRRTVIILSPSFLESIWGKMEFRTAHSQAMREGRARVIVILYGDVDIDNLDDELKAYLNTKTYVKWGDPYFWNKLKYALPHSKRNVPRTNQKHANVMREIDDKFNLVISKSPSTPNLESTPPVLTLDPTLLKNQLNFPSVVNTSSTETGSLIVTSNL